MTVLPVDSVQRVVDRLSSELTRSIAVDDSDGDLIAASRHYGDEDEARIGIVLARRPSPPVADYLRGLGLQHLTGPTRIAGCTEIGFEARVCYPIPVRGQSKCFLWIIDDGSELNHDLILESCLEIARVLERRHLRAYPNPEIAAEVVMQALRHDSGESSISDLLDKEPALHTMRAQLVAFLDSEDAPISLGLSGRLQESLRYEEERFGHCQVHHVRFPGGCVLVLLYAPALLAQQQRPGDVIAHLERLGVSCTAKDAQSGDPAPVGVSDIGSLRRIRELLAQAVAAAFAVQYFVPGGRPLAWCQLGFLQSFIAPSTLTPDVRPLTELTRVLNTERDPFLVETLEAFLRHAGDTTRTAEQLHIHRTTLYYRLNQITKRTGLDLNDGRQRLAAHLIIIHRRLEEEPLRSILVQLERRTEPGLSDPFRNQSEPV